MSSQNIPIYCKVSWLKNTFYIDTDIPLIYTIFIFMFEQETEETLIY